MDKNEKNKRIQEIHEEITKLTEELSQLECNPNDCEGCPFKELTTTDSNQTLDCGGFIDLFMYN